MPSGLRVFDLCSVACRADTNCFVYSPEMAYSRRSGTPKKKTLELFGEKQHDGTFLLFHLYTMRQAIERQFILDVLKHDMTYHHFFNLRKRIQDDPRYEKRKGTYLLKS